MLGSAGHDTTKLLNGWRLVEETTGSGVAALSDMFGDPSWLCYSASEV